MSGRCRLYSSGPSHFAAVLGCKAALSYPSPSVEGEGDRAKRGGGEEARPPNFPSTMLRMVPLPTLRAGRIMDGPHLPIPYPRIVPVSMNRWCHARTSPASTRACTHYHTPIARPTYPFSIGTNARSAHLPTLHSTRLPGAPP